MNDLQRHNRRPLSRLAAHLLVRAGQDPDPALLHPLQLVLWGLNEHPDEMPVDPHNLAELRALAEGLEAEPPAKVLLLLGGGGNPAQAEQALLPQLRQDHDPLSASQRLTENLLAALQRNNPRLRGVEYE